MANEMRFDGSIVVSTSNFKRTITPGAIQIDLAEKNMRSGVVVVNNTTNGQLIATAGDSANGGIFFFRNLASSGTIQIGRQDSGTFRAVIELKPGEYSIGRLASDLPGIASTGLCAKASGSDMELEFTVFDGT